MTRNVMLLLLFIIAAPVYADITNFWKSCDDQWKDYWKKSHSSDTPSCEPADKWLKQYPDGIAAVRREEFRQNRISLVELGDYSYGRGNILALNLALSVRLTNKGDRVLEHVKLLCNVDVNDSVQLYSGLVHAFPKLIPGGSASTDMYFTASDLLANILGGGYRAKEEDRFLPTTNISGEVKKVGVSCEIRDVDFKLIL